MPRVACLALAVLLALAASAASAGAGTLGLIVAGDQAKQPIIEGTLDPWLKQRGYDVKLRSADTKLSGTLSDCFFLVGDQDCGEAAVAKLKLDFTLFVMVQVTRDTKANADEVKLTGWLYGDKGTIVAQSQTCRACKNDTLGPTVEALAKALFAVVGEGTGRISIRSQPTGAAVTIDGDKVGATPWEQGLLTGSHTIKIELSGYVAQTQQVEIKKDETQQVDVALVPGATPPPPGRGGRKKWPLAVAITGGVLAIGGVVMVLVDEDCNNAGACDTPADRDYVRNTAPLGYGLIGAGALGLGTGLWLYLRGGAPSAAPTAWIDPGKSGGVGMAGRF